jgi:DNA-binding NarL/FixJ family response regulator
LIVDDHPWVREGLVALLGSQPGFEIVGAVGDGRQAIKVAKAIKVDVVLMDAAMPTCDGLEATRRIVRLRPDCKVLAFSWCWDEGSVQSMLQAGAAGYLCKSSPPAEVVRAIRAVRAGKAFLSRHIRRTARLWVQGQRQGSMTATLFRARRATGRAHGDAV